MTVFWLVIPLQTELHISNSTAEAYKNIFLLFLPEESVVIVRTLFTNNVKKTSV